MSKTEQQGNDNPDEMTINGNSVSQQSTYIGLVASVLFHAMAIMLALFGMQESGVLQGNAGTRGNGAPFSVEEYVPIENILSETPPLAESSVDDAENETVSENIQPSKENVKETNPAQNNTGVTNQNNQNNNNSGQPGATGNSGTFAAGNLSASADTTGLKQVYKESTLNVRIKYPSGWSFLDQNRRNKLDGVTFIGSPQSNGKMPYVNLKVEEKYRFNPQRYRYKTELNGYEAYYNDPREMEGQVTQVVYIRTDGDEDYSLKLIIDGMDAYKEFQPVFFGMVKTFRFGGFF